jgi:hypothetical protein
MPHGTKAQRAERVRRVTVKSSATRIPTRPAVEGNGLSDRRLAQVRSGPPRASRLGGRQRQGSPPPASLGQPDEAHLQAQPNSCGSGQARESGKGIAPLTGSSAPRVRASAGRDDGHPDDGIRFGGYRGQEILAVARHAGCRDLRVQARAAEALGPMRRAGAVLGQQRIGVVERRLTRITSFMPQGKATGRGAPCRSPGTGTSSGGSAGRVGGLSAACRGEIT